MDIEAEENDAFLRLDADGDGFITLKDLQTVSEARVLLSKDFVMALLDDNDIVALVRWPLGPRLSRT